MRRLPRALGAMFALAAFGTLFQVGGCGVGDAVSYVMNLNPCGTILNCDPYSYEYTTNYDGPGVDIDFDPTCTWPPYCE